MIEAGAINDGKDLGRAGTHKLDRDQGELVNASRLLPNDPDCSRDFRYWHLADLSGQANDVCSRG